jgi:hypothetical protein
MNQMLKYFLQICAYAAFMVFIGVFAQGPTYEHLARDAATIKLSLRHSGIRLEPCKDRSQQELADLPANMRAPQICPRERSPLILELDLNEEPVYAETLQPRGLHSDGRTSVYKRLSVPAGKMDLQVRMKDDVNSTGFQYQQDYTVNVDPADVVVIDFDEQTLRFVFHHLREST